MQLEKLERDGDASIQKHKWKTANDCEARVVVKSQYLIPLILAQTGRIQALLSLQLQLQDKVAKVCC